VTWYTGENAAERAGVEPSYPVRLVDLDASQETRIMFGHIGPVELNGVSGTVHLLRAHIA
jgi:hypothetical protein